MVTVLLEDHFEGIFANNFKIIYYKMRIKDSVFSKTLKEKAPQIEKSEGPTID